MKPKLKSKLTAEEIMERIEDAALQATEECQELSDEGYLNDPEVIERAFGAREALNNLLYELKKDRKT